jgi:hypothetical protein
VSGEIQRTIYQAKSSWQWVAAAFKGPLRQISQKTGEAASEGGGLFGGGVQVSDAEKATLGEISSVLGIKPRRSERPTAARRRSTACDAMARRQPAHANKLIALSV